MTLTILGSGGSMGIPVLGCSCLSCQTSKPRTRAASLLKLNDQNILIDTGPDIRQQGLAIGLDRVDAVFLTHVHYDHVSGIDDLRPLYFKQGGPIPVYLSQNSLDEIEKRYSYLLDKFIWRTTDFPFDTISYVQAGMEVLGFRIGTFAYITDIKEYDEALLQKLSGIKTLVLSALRQEPSPVHFNIDEAITFVEKLNNPKTHLIHIAHELDVPAAEKKLPSYMQLAYDGLEIEI